MLVLLLEHMDRLVLTWRRETWLDNSVSFQTCAEIAPQWLHFYYLQALTLWEEQTVSDRAEISRAPHDQGVHTLPIASKVDLDGIFTSTGVLDRDRAAI